jgi:molybdate transport system regulatory protein
MTVNPSCPPSPDCPGTRRLMTKRNRRLNPDLELCVTIDGQVIIGPIQAMVLEAIRSTGSISAAHRELGKSYAHIWKLVAAMNEMFDPPLVGPVRGGAQGGGAVLTEQGCKVLEAFRRLERLSRTHGRAELLVIGQGAGHAMAKPQ